MLALLAVKEPLSRTAVLARLPDISPKALDRADLADDLAADLAAAWPKAIDRARDTSDAVRLTRAMSTTSLVTPTAYAYNLAMRRCMRTRPPLWRLALELFDEMGTAGAEPDAYSYGTALDACAKGRQADMALALLIQMGERLTEPPNAICYGAAIAACASEGRAASALALLEQMGEGGTPAPNAKCFNAAIAACDRGARPDDALAVLSRMSRTPKVTPDVVSYSSAISACARVPSHARRALQLLDAMRRRRIRPNAYTYTAAIGACATLGEATIGLDLLGRYRASANFSAIYADRPTAGHAAAHARVHRAAMKASTHAKIVWDCRRDLTPPSCRDHSCHRRRGLLAAAQACARNGRWEESVSVADMMRADGLSLEVRNLGFFTHDLGDDYI